MKKFLTLSAALLLSIAFAMFAGCSTALERGRIEGNYKAPTQEELMTALSTMEGDSMFGDPQQADWEFGVKTGVNFNLKITLDDSAFTTNIKVTLEEKFSKGETGPNLLGKGNLSYQMKMPAELTNQATDIELKANLYNDSSYLYLDASAKSGKDSQEMKVKTDLSAILDGMLTGETEFSPMSIASETGYQESASATVGFSADELLEFATEWNMQFGLDTSDGVKLRLTGTQETYAKILNQIMEDVLGSSLDMSDLISLSDTVFELYLQADKDGNFVAAAANLKLKGSAEIPAMSANAETSSLGVDIGGAFYIENKASNFSIPQGIADDPSYQIIDSGLLN